MLVDLLLDPFGARWHDVHAAAGAAEARGFSGIWTWDHLSGRVHGAPDVLECWTVLTAVAATVPRLTVGSLVLNVANRDAGTLAVMAATLQDVSGGRLILGLGAGGGRGTPYAYEQEILGRPLYGDAARRDQVEDTVGVLRRCWSGEHGLLAPDPRPPVIIGGFGPKTISLAARVADGVNVPLGRLDLAEMARAAHPDPERFLVTAFGGFDRKWLEPANALPGVDRLIMLVSPPYREVTA
jgi:alkanesulfonate monooxygenase SsuD/methylene tetrahydromethanopterin reductase-like flavin-dependent oxidoreductase (luciferase family)